MDSDSDVSVLPPCTSPHSYYQLHQDRKLARVVWYCPRKRYGFLAPLGGGADVFVHGSGLAHGRGLPLQGEIVEYELGETRYSAGQQCAVRVADPMCSL